MNLEQELKQLRDERQKRFNEEDWEGALEVHDRILDLSPSALRYANRGSILFRLGRIQEAVQSYRKALELDPTLKRARADLERLEDQLNESQEQKETNLPLPGENTSLPQSQQDLLGKLRDERQVCLQNEDWDGALRKHDEILEIEPTALRYANKGSILYRLHKLTEAASCYRKALELDPTMERAQIDLERLEAQMEEEGLLTGEDKQDEKEIHEKIEQLRKQRQEKVEQGLWDDALALHDEVLALEPTALRHANRGALLYRMGKHKDAIASYRNALEMDEALEQAKEAILHLEGLLEEESLLPPEENGISPEEIASQIAQYRDQRQLHINKKEWEQALALHDKIIDLEPTAPRYINRGSMLYRMGNLEEAIKAYEKALEMDPDLESAKKDIRRMQSELTKQKDKPPVLSEQDIAKQLDELKTKRQQNIEEDNWEKALEYQNKILELEPNGLRYTNKGSMLYRMGKVNEAILCYRKALELEPELERAKSDLQRLKENEMDRLREEREHNMEEGNWQQALDIHDVILALETTALRMANKGAILYRMSRFHEAMECYKKALQLEPSLEKAKEDIARLEDEIAKQATLMAEQDFEEDEEEFFYAVPTDEPTLDDVESEEYHTKRYENKNILLHTLEGHQGEINDIKWIPNTSQLVSAGKDKTIKIWDLDNQNCIRTLEGHDDWIRFLAINPDNSYVFSASDDWNVRTWNLNTGQCEYILEGHTMPVLYVSTSPSHRFLFSTSRDRTIKIWDYQSGKLLSTLDGHKDWVNNFIPTADGNKAISSSLDGSLRIWNVLGWRCTNTLEGHKAWIEHLFLIQNGKKIVSASSDGTIKIWDFADATHEKTIEVTSTIVDMCLTKDESKIVAAMKDNTLRVWDISSGDCIKIIRGQNSPTHKLALSANDEYIFSSCRNGDIWIWNMADGNKIQKYDNVGIVNRLAVIENKNWIIGGCSDSKIRVWNMSLLGN